MEGPLARVSKCLAAAPLLLRAGVCVGSVLRYPVRRRLGRCRNQLDLRNGISLESPLTEGLLALFKEIWIDRCYAPAGFDVAPGDTVVDIGANVGVFTLWAASRHREVKVVALEPSPWMCGFLRRNIAASGLTNVTVLQSAAGGTTGEGTLYSRGGEAFNSLYCRDVHGSTFVPLARTEILALDDVLGRCDVHRCDLLKLDCEGAEYDILMNAGPATLASIRRISLEYHVGLNDHTPEELVDFLAGRGFGVVRLPQVDPESGYLYARRVD